MKRKKKLSAYIEKDKSKETMNYKITIDGDVFWADDYPKAIKLLLRIIIRDEL